MSPLGNGGKAVGKLFGIIAILVVLYIGITLYTEGSQRAFGGVLASIGSEEEAPASGGTLDRVRDRVNADFQEASRRRGYDDLD